MQKKIIEPSEAQAWIHRCIYGSITPQQLYDDRIEELNVMDQM